MRKLTVFFKQGKHNYSLSHPKIAIAGANQKTAIPNWVASPLPRMTGME